MKPEKLLVRAAHKDRPCPMERTQVKPNRATGRDDSMIYDDVPVEVPNSSFYRRAIAKGDLVEVKPSSPARPAVAPAKPAKE